MTGSRNKKVELKTWVCPRCKRTLETAAKMVWCVCGSLMRRKEAVR